MMVIMTQGYKQQEFDAVLRRLEELKLTGHPIIGVERTVIAVVGHIYPELGDELETMPGVEDTVPISAPYKLAGRETKQEDTVIKVGSVEIGSGKTVIIAGPCAVENEQQLMETARGLSSANLQKLMGLSKTLGTLNHNRFQRFAVGKDRAPVDAARPVLRATMLIVSCGSWSRPPAISKPVVNP